MFALGIRYLNGWVTAAEVSDRNRVEWPPHPGRVFMALAAAHFTGDRDPAERAALEWLEALEPPAIRAGGCLARSVVTNYVPVNDKPGPAKAILQSAPGLTRTRQPRTFARAWLEDDTVYLRWSADLADQHRAALEALVGRVTRIGHSSTLVQAWLETAETFAPTLIPDERRGEQHLRVLTPGTLVYLEERYNGERLESFGELKVAETEALASGDAKAKKKVAKRLREEFGNQPPVSLRPELSRWQGYAAPREEVAPTAPGTVFDHHLLVYRLVRKESGFRALELATTQRLAQAVRGALIQVTDGSLPEAISGHQPDGAPSERPHLAILPLAYVGAEHADGKLMGLAFALPRDLEPTDRRALLLALHKVPELTLGKLGTWTLEAPTEDRLPYNLLAETWTAAPHGATEWGTVTPIALDRHAKAAQPDAYRAEVAESIAASCGRVTGGILPSRVIVLPTSPHLGVPTAREFPRLPRKDGSELRHAHAIVIFDQPIVGPLALGAGRYRGYGFCRPLG